MIFRFLPEKMLFDKDTASIIAEYAKNSVAINYITRKRGDFSIDANGTILNDLSHLPLIAQYEDAMKQFGRNIFSKKSIEDLIVKVLVDNRVEVLDWIYNEFSEFREKILKSMNENILTYSLANWLFMRYDLENNIETIYRAIVARAEMVVRAYIAEYGAASFNRAFDEIKKTKFRIFHPSAQFEIVYWVKTVLA